MKKIYTLLLLAFSFVSQAQNSSADQSVENNSRVIFQSGTYSLPLLSEITIKSFNKSDIKTTEVGDGDRKWKPHVLRGKNPWKGTDRSVVQYEKNLLNSNYYPC